MVPVLFVSCADEDALWCASLEKHAAQWERSGGVRLVHARRLPAGVERAAELETALDKAAVVVLLVSADHLASAACAAEATRAMARSARGEARVPEPGVFAPRRARGGAMRRFAPRSAKR